MYLMYILYVCMYVQRLKEAKRHTSKTPHTYVRMYATTYVCTFVHYCLCQYIPRLCYCPHSITFLKETPAPHTVHTDIRTHAWVSGFHSLNVKFKQKREILVVSKETRMHTHMWTHHVHIHMTASYCLHS